MTHISIVGSVYCESELSPEGDYKGPRNIGHQFTPARLRPNFMPLTRTWGIHKLLSLALSKLNYAKDTQIAVLYACWLFLTEGLNVPIFSIHLQGAQIKFVSTPV